MIAARLTVLGACVGLAMLFGGALDGWPKKVPATPCAPGRFLVDPGNGPLVQGSTTPPVDSVTVDGQSRIAVGSGCLAVAGHVTAKSRFTKVQAKWPSCGTAGTGKLKAKVASPDCSVMTGRFKTRGAKPKSFTARRSTCGDGVVDEPGGEQCEPTTGGCAGDVACSAACTCDATTTTVPGFTCGGIGHRCGGTCPDGETCVLEDLNCDCRPTCGGSAPACDGVCPSGETCRRLPRLGGCECTSIVGSTTSTTESTTTTSTTETTTTTLEPCHDIGGLNCGGSCGPRAECIHNLNPLNPGCYCLALPF